jgi:SSS family solute:Na+ symporter
MFGLFLLGFISRKAGKAEAIIGVIIGVIVIVWMSLSPLIFTEGDSLKFRSPFHSNLTIVFGTLTIFLIGFVLTKLINRK